MKKKTLRVLLWGLLFTTCLGGCNAKAPAPETSRAESSAAFVACLKAAGTPAKLSEAGGMVMVPGEAVGVDVETSGEGLSASVITSQTGDDSGVLLSENDEAGLWVAPRDSAAIKADARLQATYQSCEAKFPDFSQPRLSANKSLQANGQADAESALKFTKCARGAGFSWIEDPAPGTEVVILPQGLGREEFRAALDACMDPGQSFGWAGPENIPDLMGVLEDYYRSAPEK